MKILVTGGAGFIGSAVVRLAINRGHTIINVDSLTYASCLKNIEEVSDDPKYHFEHIDICNRSSLDQVFMKHNPDSVMHLAAESHVDRSIDSPKQFIKTNITGTFNILEASRKYWESQGRPNSFKFHHVSTDEVYGSLPSDPKILFKETTPYDPRSPYSASKASSDHLVNAWYETYNLPTIITNCSNNYGPYQFPEKLVPVVILNAINGKPIPIYGDGKNIRDWLYVGDHAEALMICLEKGIIGNTYNIGGNNEKSNVEIVELICSILNTIYPSNNGNYHDQISYVSDRLGHDLRYAIDASKIQNQLGWRPSVSLEEGLKKTIVWYLDNHNWWKNILDEKNL